MEHVVQFTIAGISLIMAILTDRIAKDPPVEKPVFRKRKLVWVILVFLFAFAICSYWNKLVSKGEAFQDILKSWRGIAPILGLIILVLCIQIFIEKSRPASFGFCIPKNWGVLLPISLFVAVGSLMSVPSHGIPALALIMWMLLIFMEELFNKGLIQKELENLFGIKYMWIIAGLLFGLYHIPLDFWGSQYIRHKSYLFSFEQLAIQTCGGLWACVIYKKSRSIFPLVVIHWIGNNYHIYLFHAIKSLF